MTKKSFERPEILRLMVEQADTARAVRRQPGRVERWRGYMVKKAFPQVAERGVRDEFMWVRVTGVRDERLVGRLANSPVLATYLACGDEVEFGEDEVVAAEWPDDTQQTNAGVEASITTEYSRIAGAAAHYRREGGRHNVSLDQSLIDDIGVIHLRTPSGRWIAMYDEHDGRYTRLSDRLVRLAAGECGWVD